MTTGFSASVNPSASANLSASTDFSTSDLMALSPSAGSGLMAPPPSAGSGLMARSPLASSLLPIILHMTKPFHIKKLVTRADNTSTIKILKSTIWIAGVPSSTLNKTWQYMLGISDPAYQKEIAEDFTYQQMLAAERLGYKHETMAKFLKKN